VSSPASASASASAPAADTAAGYRDGLRAALAIAATVWFFGASFGLLARAAGMGVLAPLVMSATTFAGSAQFAASSILGGAGGAAAAIAAAVLLNARYAPISISVAPLFRGPRLRRLLESQLIVDESWALAARGGRFDRRILLGAGLLLYVSWVLGTAVGALAGDALGDPKDFGLDGAFPALFLALLVPQARRGTAAVAALAGAAIALALIPVTPPGTPIVVASAACLLGLRRRP
jgi:4-azaleucine resistance transporter AzlC